jgi:hypothetical protein
MQIHIVKITVPFNSSIYAILPSIYHYDYDHSSLRVYFHHSILRAYFEISNGFYASFAFWNIKLLPSAAINVIKSGRSAKIEICFVAFMALNSMPESPFFAPPAAIALAAAAAS